MVWNLEAYGEHDVAVALSEAPEQVLFLAWIEASQAMLGDPERRMIDHYLARGAVKAITGSDRPLARKVRRFVHPEPKAAISADQLAAWNRWWTEKSSETRAPS
ncbi:hypothetical protein [Brevundimonas sp. R86498]|uniref:hypothetical protein n=1 Tax=Brevundimonas sp. R86498 TaxID=3093845 RepID=UPI0037C6332B